MRTKSLANNLSFLASPLARDRLGFLKQKMRGVCALAMSRRTLNNTLSRILLNPFLPTTKRMALKFFVIQITRSWTPPRDIFKALFRIGATLLA